MGILGAVTVFFFFFGGCFFCVAVFILFFGVFLFLIESDGERIKFFRYLENGHTIFFCPIKRRLETLLEPQPVRHDQRGIAQLRGLCCRRFKIMRVSAEWNKDLNVDLVATHLSDKVAEDWRGRNHEWSIRVDDCRC